MDKNGCFVVVFSFFFFYAAGTVYCHLSCDHIRYSGTNDAKTFGFEKSHFLKKVYSKEDLKYRGRVIYPRFLYREQNGEEIRCAEIVTSLPGSGHIPITEHLASDPCGHGQVL